MIAWDSSKYADAQTTGADTLVVGMRTAFARIRKVRALSEADRKLVPGAPLAVLAVRARLLRLPFARVRDWAAAPALLAARVGRAVAAASARVPGWRNCLVRAIEYCRVHSEIFPKVLRYRLLNGVIPAVLDLIGIKSIHATAFLTDYGACAFIGPGGTGKSTLAASFALAGFPLLGDDWVVLSLSGSGQIVLTPGYPGAWLSNESVEALRIDSARSDAVAGYNSERCAPDLHLNAQPQPLGRIIRLSRHDAVDPRANLAAKSVPLKWIYRLNRLDNDADQTYAPKVEHMSWAESLVELASASWLFESTDRAANLHKLRFLKQVVAKVPVKKLVVPNDFTALPAVREMVLADMRGCNPESAKLSAGR